jgi:hypothetical protein
MDLRDRDEAEILKHEGVSRSADGLGYELSFLNARYLIDAVNERMVELEPMPERILTEEFQILLIRYLVSPYGGPLDDKEASEKDFAGGVTFFQGPHALHTAVLAKLYGNDPDAFEQRCRELGAVPAAFGDKAMRFSPLPLIPVTYVLWKQDDEFPASVSVMFDSSIARWFELDMIFMVVWVVTERIIEGQRRPRQ